MVVNEVKSNSLLIISCVYQGSDEVVKWTFSKFTDGTKLDRCVNFLEGKEVLQRTGWIDRPRPML